MKNGLGNLAATDTGQLTAIIKNRLQKHPVPASPHPRVPRPDRAHPQTQTAVDLNLSISVAVLRSLNAKRSV